MRRRGPSWRATLAVLVSPFAVLPAGALAYLALETPEQDRRRAMLTSLDGIATAEAAAIDRLTETRMGDVMRIAFPSPITRCLTMVISTAIRDADTQEIGVLAARLNLEEPFASINDTTGLGETGETVVGKRIEEELVLMAPTRPEPVAAPNRRHALDRSARTRAMLPAASGHSGADVSEGHRGRRMLAAWRPARALGRGLVVEMDEAEAMRAAHAVRNETIEIGLGIFAMAVPASIFVSRELVRPLRDLIDATDRIGRGDRSMRLSLASAELADSFERMVAAIERFREHARPDDEEPYDLDTPTEERGAPSSESSERA